MKAFTQKKKNICYKEFIENWEQKKVLWDNPIEHPACLIPVKDMGTAKNKQTMFVSI